MLLPAEFLAADGLTAAGAAFALADLGWLPSRVSLTSDAFALYWTRSADLAARTSTWVAPRCRNLGILIDPDPLAIRPYVQLLNTSTWLLYADDLDPDHSHPEFLAYLLAHGDRMAVTGEVTQVAVQNAAWWFDRSDDECAAFAAAAARSNRPDADGFRALAAALPWLRQLRHEVLRPPGIVSPHRSIPGTGLLVPRAVESEPPALVARWTAVATATMQRYQARWRRSDPAAVTALCTWLAETAPPLLVLGHHQRLLWDPAHPTRIGSVRDVLRQADAAAVAGIAADLDVIDRHTRSFLDSLVTPAELPAPAPTTTHSGLTFLHRDRRLIAYDLFEAGMERLHGPPLPYEHAMVGARTVHEWAHVADTAGWVPRTVTPEDWTERRTALAVQLETVIARAPAAVNRLTASDRAALAETRPLGEAMVRILVSRLPDFRANLLARHYLTPVERETYVRHNIRTLHGEYPPPHLWRLLLRYVFEFQYLRFSVIQDPRRFFLHTTSCYRDFIATGLCDEATFDGLTAAVGALCDAYAVDQTRFHFPPPST